MRNIRFGKDITTRWRIRTNGEDEPLEHRDLHLILTDQFGNKSELPFVIDDTNLVSFVWFGKDHKRYGQHIVTLFENLGEEGQTAVDAVDYVNLVEYTSQENEGSYDNLTMETIDLEGDITTSGRGLNNYELWLLDGHEGTLEDFLEWSKGPQGEPGKDGKSLTFDDLTDEQKEALRGLPGTPGKDGLDAKINGVNVLSIVEGANMRIRQDGSKMTFDSLPPEDVVHKTGDETIGGRKSFSNPIAVGGLEIEGYESHVKVVSSRASSPTDIRLSMEAKTPQGDIDVRLHGVATPTSNSDAANKKYVDEATKNLYEKPSAGIPKADLASGVQSSLEKADVAYAKPSTGIPESDLSEAVQQKLNEGGDGVFIAEYGVTSYADIKAAYDAGKEVITYYVISRATGDTVFLSLTQTDGDSYFAFHGAFSYKGTKVYRASIMVYGGWQITELGDMAMLDDVAAKYTKPSDGIPKTDLASDVQSSLAKADTALQKHQDISGKADKSELTALSSKIGELSNLETEAKDNLVAAINEAAQKGPSGPFKTINGESIEGEGNISIPKGDKGDKGDTGAIGPQGLQGNTGSSVDYPFELVNNLSEGGVNKALSAEMGKRLDEKMPVVEEDGFYVCDSEGNIAVKYGRDGLDAAKVSEHFKYLLSPLNSVVFDVAEDGIFFVDAQMNIGIRVDGDGVHGKNILEFEIE